MENTKRRKWLLSLLILMLSFGSFSIFTGCGTESEEMSRKKLSVILASDLDTILSGMAKENLIAEPHYELVFFKAYRKGEFTYKAIAEFYFLKGVQVKIVRKYRFHRLKGMWERYYNEYQPITSPQTPTSK